MTELHVPTELPFEGEDFRELLMDFIEHRTEIKKPLTQVALKRLLKRLGRYTQQECTTAMEVSIDCGWSGVFPENVKKYDERSPASTKPYSERLASIAAEMAERDTRGY